MSKVTFKKITVRRSSLYAGIIHLLMLLVIIISLSFPSTSMPPQALPFREADKIINAVSVNQTQIQQEMAHLRAQKEVAQQKEAARLAQLKQEASEAAAAKKAQEAILTKLKQTQALQQKQAEAELAALQAQKLKMEKQITTLKQPATSSAKKTPPAKAVKNNTLQQAAMADLQKELSQEQTQLNEQKNVQINSEIQKYTLLMLQAMQQNWHYPPGVNPASYCILEIQLAPGGKVMSVTLKKSSGNQMLDQSAIAAVYQSSPLPVSPDPAVFEKMRDINLKAMPAGQVM